LNEGVEDEPDAQIPGRDGGLLIPDRDGECDTCYLPFAGIGAGTINGNAFSGAFTFVFTADTSAIDTSGAPFYRLNNIGGTFSEGDYSALLAPTITSVATASAQFPRINFFNATFDNGLGINDPALAAYNLFTSFGPLTVTDQSQPPSNLLPTFGAGSFLTVGGDHIAMTRNTSLTFSAVARSVPEPMTLVLLAIGLIAVPLARRLSQR
jgi:hypothetical protein